MTESDEQCDDGNDIDGDGCESDCTLSDSVVCGDGRTDAPFETCDDGNSVGGDGCSALCEVERGGGPSGNGWGDPHYVTYDGLSYDLQTVGESVLTRSLLGGFEVQTRTAPYGTSRLVSVSTAVAARVMDDVVTVYLGQGEVFVNHEPVAMSGLLDLPSGGAVSVDGTATQINWPSGEIARITNSVVYLNVRVELSGAVEYLDLVGLMGDADGSSVNDIRSRGATAPLLSPVSNYDLYTFGDSWRVTQEESLFDYGVGENTDTYTNPEFPYGSVDAANLAADVRAPAEDACTAAGVVDPIILEGCILDQAVTGGDPAFLEGVADLPSPVASLDVPNSAVRLPGADAYVELPVTLAGLGVTDQFTLSIQTRSDPVGGFRMLLDEDLQGRFDSDTRGLKLVLNPEQPAVKARLFTTTLSYFIDVGTPALIDTWNTLSMSYDGTTVRIYVNGAQVGQVAAAGNVYPARRNMRIGFPSASLYIPNGQFRVSTEYFAGLVGSVQIWNVALAPQELAETLGRDLLGTEPGLVGYWRINEGGGTTIHDLTANENHGLIVGDAFWE